MPILHRVHVAPQRRALVLREGALERVLAPGIYRFWDPFGRLAIEIVDTLSPWLEHAQLESFVRSGRLGEEVQVVELGDRQRGLVWVDGRFDRVLGAGVHAYWSSARQVEVEIVDIDGVLVRHAKAYDIYRRDQQRAIDLVRVAPGHVALLFVDGKLVETLQPGLYGLWKHSADYVAIPFDMREIVAEISGQELMTADKVTLRMNAVVTYRVVDPALAQSEVVEYGQALYRDAQLALRAVIGGRELDALLSDKEAVAAELRSLLAVRASGYGVMVVGLGLRDIILPGDMKTLLNQVMEAEKAAQAANITRREETAAMRSQANTAKLLESNPTLMRLRELEVVQAIAQKSNLTLVLGEKSLCEGLTKLI